MAKTSASYTIMDYNDGITVISRLSSNHPKTLAYDPATGVYNPDWTAVALAITPSAVVAGRSGDIIASGNSQKWYYRRSGEIDWNLITSGQNGFTIAASTYVLSLNSMALFDGNHVNLEFKFSFIYHDNTLGIDFTQEVVDTYTRISNGTSVVVARAWSQNGNLFKNKKIPTKITLEAELIRGVAADITALTYQWQKYSAGTWTNITSATSKTYDVLPANVDGSAQFRCKITDTDSSSDTYNTVFTTNGELIMDLTDPYQAKIFSSNGAFFKNGAGTTVLTCRIFQDGEEVTSGFTYKWYKSGSASVLGTAKTLTVTSSDINIITEFTCEVD